MSHSQRYQNIIETGHQILFDKTTTIATTYFLRKYKEALQIQKYPDNSNRNNEYNISVKYENHPPGY